MTLNEEMIIYHIVQGKLEPIKEPKFNSGDSYIIDQGKTIWIWIGKESQVDEKFIAARGAQELDFERRGLPKVRSCFQGEEDKELLKALGPDFRVVEGDTPSMLIKVDTSFKPQFRMIRVQQVGSEINYEDVPFSRDSLDSNDVFVVVGLMSKEAMMIYNWIGNSAQPKEKFFGALKSDLIDKEFREAPQTITLHEGEETAGFNFLFKAFRDYTEKS